MGGSAPTIKNQNTSTSDRTLNIMKGTTTVAIFDGNGHLLGGSDNTFNLGEGSTRWGTVFAATGTINTSDKNEKNTIIESDLGLDFVNKLKPVSFKWNKDDSKTHYGLIVQDIEETITSLGKSVQDFGGIDKQKNAPMGLNYSELFAPLIKAVQELSAKVAALEVA